MLGRVTTMIDKVTNPTWEVKAWCTAPGDFPSRSLESVKVQAPYVKEAVAAAHKQLDQGFLNVITVSVQRVKPPFTSENF